MAVFHENARIKLVNIQHVLDFRGGIRPSTFDVDMHARWSQRREQYRYADLDYHGPAGGSAFGRDGR